MFPTIYSIRDSEIVSPRRARLGRPAVELADFHTPAQKGDNLRLPKLTLTMMQQVMALTLVLISARSPIPAGLHHQLEVPG